MSLENSLLKDFEIDAKNPSEETQRKWRRAVSLVRNRRRRFRHVPDLNKRAEVQFKVRQAQVPHPPYFYFLL